MNPSIMGRFLMAAALLMGAGVAGAADKTAANGPETDAGLASSVRHEIIMWANYSIWDDVRVEASNGNVHVSGVVLDPTEKVAIGRLAKQVAGVVQVQNDIRVLPTSIEDDRLRMRVARAVYGDPNLRIYASLPLKPIHIVVENGHVTLAGVVNSELDKQIAGMRASSAGMSFGPVVNNLQVEHPPAKKS
jgi:osmotically-inducible protein OsmY